VTHWPLPKNVDPINAEFWEMQQDGVLRFQRCTDCEAFRHLPRYQCAGCGSTEYEWAPVSGRGKLYSWTVTHQVFHPAFEVPFVAAVVELDEGVRMVSQLMDVDPSMLALDLRVEVEFRRITDDFHTPVFRLVGSS